MSKSKTDDELALDQQLLKAQELRHHRRSVIFIQGRSETDDRSGKTQYVILTNTITTTHTVITTLLGGRRGSSRRVSSDSSQGGKRVSGRKSARRSDGFALREQLKRKSSNISSGRNNSNGNNSSGWGWLGWRSSDNNSEGSTKNPLGSAMEMGVVSVSKRRSDIERGELIILNCAGNNTVGRNNNNRRGNMTMDIDDVSNCCIGGKRGDCSI